MKYIVSRYNHDISWIPEYTDDVVMYDRSEDPLAGAIIAPNVGSDIYDKLTYIIENYENLPEVAVYAKANLFKYISKEEFDKVKDNKTFTPLLTQNHRVYSDESGRAVCYYQDGMYYEVNNLWYLASHPCKVDPVNLMLALGIAHLRYIPFAPGSNYILPKENIQKHPKGLYEELRSLLDWSVYPGEAQVIERGLYTLWR